MSMKHLHSCLLPWTTKSSNPPLTSPASLLRPPISLSPASVSGSCLTPSKPHRILCPRCPQPPQTHPLQFRSRPLQNMETPQRPRTSLPFSRHALSNLPTIRITTCEGQVLQRRRACADIAYQARKAPKKTDHTWSKRSRRDGATTLRSKLAGKTGVASRPLGNTNAPGSIQNPFVKGLFSTKAIPTQAHPRNEDTIVDAIDKAEGDDQPDASDGGKLCVAGEFRAALDTLFEMLHETQPWYVFCVNPNDSLKGRSMKGQARDGGVGG
jgi:hypothetical protein